MPPDRARMTLMRIGWGTLGRGLTVRSPRAQCQGDAPKPHARDSTQADGSGMAYRYRPASKCRPATALPACASRPGGGQGDGPAGGSRHGSEQRVDDPADPEPQQAHAKPQRQNVGGAPVVPLRAATDEAVEDQGDADRRE